MTIDGDVVQNLEVRHGGGDANPADTNEAWTPASQHHTSEDIANGAPGTAGRSRRSAPVRFPSLRKPRVRDLLQYMQIMFAKQGAAIDTANKTLSSKVSEHDEIIFHLSQTVGKLNEKLEMLELVGGVGLDAAATRRLKWIEKQHSAPHAPRETRSGEPSSGSSGCLGSHGILACAFIGRRWDRPRRCTL